MSGTAKLALKIALGTIIVLCAGVGVICGVLIARAPTANSPEIVLQTGHAGSVNSVAWSPDGRTLASASSDNTLKLWDRQRGQCCAA
jgi:WD40 repeat protein